MESVRLIVAALAVGAATSASETESAVVKDAYVRLRQLVLRRLGHNQEAVDTLAGYETNPDRYEGRMVSRLQAAGAWEDIDLHAAAEVLLSRAEAAGARGRYKVDAGGAQGVQVGDNDVSVTISGSVTGVDSDLSQEPRRGGNY